MLDPFNEDQLGPNSYDLTLHDEVLAYPRDYIIDPKRGTFWLDARDRIAKPGLWKLDPNDGLAIQPGHLYLACTRETAGSHTFATRIEGRSSLARSGVRVHQTGGFGDVGFVGQWTLEIDCVIPFVLYPGMRIAQLSFHAVQGEVDVRYDTRSSSKYAGSQGPKPARWEKEFPR